MNTKISLSSWRKWPIGTFTLDTINMTTIFKLIADLY